MGQQVIALEDKAEVVAAQAGERQRIERRGILSPEQILATAGAIEAAQQVHQGRFAGAGGANDGDHLSGFDNEIEGMEDGHLLLAALVAPLDPF